jgi:hypothetical protein
MEQVKGVEHLPWCGFVDYHVSSDSPDSVGSNSRHLLILGGISLRCKMSTLLLTTHQMDVMMHT